MIQHHRGMPPFERVGRAADFEPQQDTSRNKHQYREPHRQAHGLSNYGTTLGGRHYSLEVIQNPIRARMCGFGDKDRRPLAPAAVAKMVVRDENLQLVDVDDIDFAFFIASVDLWSADGEREVNLVLHPSSADRYIPATQVTKRRRATNSTPPAQPIPSTSAFSAQPQGPEPAPTTTSFAAFSSQSFSFGPDQTSPFSFGQNATLFATSDLPPTDHSSPSFLSADPAWHDSAGRPVHLPVRGWATDPSHDLSLGGPSDAAPATQHNDGFDPRLADTGALFGSLAPPSQPQPPLAPPGQETLSMQISGLSPRAAGQGQTSFTRTLVGPLVSNAQKLLDEHRKAGIFFLFQDLSVRTEGQFRLRIRLMNVGMPPAPNRGATRIHQSSSNVLAQAFTESFTVFSAKRFPGVPDTTALSIAFGNQGQKLPLRNRNGKRGRKDDDSGDDDD